MRPSNNLENNTPLDKFWRVQNSMYESSGLQFFKTTTGVQSGPDAFDESRFVMTLFNHLASYRSISSTLDAVSD